MTCPPRSATSVTPSMRFVRPKALGCKVFLGAGSQAEYGRVSGILRPDTPAFPENGYGMAKLCAGQMSRVECQTLGMDHVWARILSVYGPHDGPATMISGTVHHAAGRRRPQADGRGNNSGITCTPGTLPRRSGAWPKAAATARCIPWAADRHARCGNISQPCGMPSTLHCRWAWAKFLRTAAGNAFAG